MQNRGTTSGLLLLVSGLSSCFLRNIWAPSTEFQLKLRCQLNSGFSSKLKCFEAELSAHQLVESEGFQLTLRFQLRQIKPEFQLKLKCFEAELSGTTRGVLPRMRGTINRRNRISQTAATAFLDPHS